MDVNPAIRPELPEDIPAIRQVHELAFGSRVEADIVDRLRRRGALSLSLVAVDGNQVLGHILFSPVTIRSEQSSFEAVALGPMAVLPSFQRMGIGSGLVRAGLAACREKGDSIVIVLGHPQFYPRFGFQRACQFGIHWEYDVPPEVFMLAELEEGALQGRRGQVHYQPEFRP